MRLRLHFLLFLLGSLTSQIWAEGPRVLNFDVFPPKAEIRVFFPDSPPQGDLLPNGQDFSLSGDYLSLRIRVLAEGFETKEDEIKLLEVRAVKPGYFEYKTALRPTSLRAHMQSWLHFYPQVLFAIAAVALFVLFFLTYIIRKRLRRADRLLKDTQAAAACELAELREKMHSGQIELVGQVFEEYTILEELGEGSFSKVYKGRHNALGDLVAIKILKYGIEGEEILSRMRREIAIGTGLKHPNVVRLFAFGTFNKAPYLVTEFVPGRPLDLVLQKEKLPLSRSIHIIEQVFQGVSYAHKQSVVHRDLKPANLFLTDKDEVKILDFGMARMLESEQKLTKTGQALGTPLYMSPEQVHTKFGPESDYYAVGVIFFEMLTGVCPFTGDTALEILSGHAFKKPPRVHELNPEIPLAISDLVDSLLKKKPSERLVDLSVISKVLLSEFTA